MHVCVVHACVHALHTVYTYFAGLPKAISSSYSTKLGENGTEGGEKEGAGGEGGGREEEEAVRDKAGREEGEGKNKERGTDK